MLTKEQRREIRKQLPKGSIVLMAKELNTTAEHVSLVLRGKYNDDKVVDMALAIIETEKAMQRERTRKFNKIMQKVA